MKLQTEISIQPLEQTIHYGDGLLFLGSCFADEVGSICKGLGFNALVNPFGVLYNPASVVQSLFTLQNGKPFGHDAVIEVGEGMFCTFSHNTAFWNTSENALLEQVNKSLAIAHEHFLKSKWLIISLGTSWAFKHIASNQLVSNCHKLPSNCFERVFIDVQSSTSLLSELIKSMPDKHFVFTVSPLRHLKDGLHENQLSKAALLLAVNEVCKSFNNAHYFPAYEILLDELRDYRFYKEDMVHPTEQAVRHIWERFIDFVVNPSEKPAMKAASNLKQMLKHKPVFPKSDAFRKFEIQKEQKIKALKHDFPNILLENLTADH